MSGTVIVPQQVSSTGAAPSFASGASSMELPNQGHTILHLKATGTVAVTAVNQTTVDGAASANKVTSLTTGQEKVVSFPPGVYNMANGNVQLTIDTPANVTVAAYSNLN